MALLIVPSAVSHARAAEVLAPPQWSSDQIRAARTLAPEDALTFNLRTETSGGKEPPTSSAATVTLAATYSHVAEGSLHTLDDRDLCRTFSWSDGKPALHNISCYAGPAFRVSEVVNRRYLAAIISGVEAHGIDTDPYWAEAELGVQEQAKDRLAKRATTDGAEYRLGDEVVVRISGSGAQITSNEAQRFAWYLANHHPLHPQVRRDLKLGDRLPQRLEIESKAGGQQRLMVLTITGVRRAEVAFPLPGCLEAELSQGDGLMARGLQQAVLAVEGRSDIPKPTPESLLASMRDTSDHSRPVEALLDFMEFTQQYGFWVKDPQHLEVLKRYVPQLQSALRDPTASKFWQANALAGDERAVGDREAAARYLATATDLYQPP